MKKWLAPILILILAVLLIACGKQITQNIKDSEKTASPSSEQPESDTIRSMQFIRIAYDMNGHTVLSEAHDCTAVNEIRPGENTVFSRPCFRVRSHEELNALFKDINQNSYYYHSEELDAALAAYDASFFEKHVLDILIFTEETCLPDYRYTGMEFLDENTAAVCLDVLYPRASDLPDAMTALLFLPTAAEVETLSMITSVWHEGENGVMQKTTIPPIKPFSIAPYADKFSPASCYYFSDLASWSLNYGNYDFYSHDDTPRPTVARILNKEEFCSFLGKNQNSPTENAMTASILADADAFFAEHALIVLGLCGTEFRILDFEAEEEITLTLEVERSAENNQTASILFLPIKKELAEAHLTVRYQKPDTAPLTGESITNADSVRSARIFYPDHERALAGIPYEKIAYRRENDAFLMRIRTREDFLNLFDRLQKQGFQETPKDSDLAACYDDAFFEEHALFVVLWNESSGSYQIRFERMLCDENGAIIIGLETTKFITETCDMATRLLFIPVDIAYIDAETVHMMTTYHFINTY